MKTSYTIRPAVESDLAAINDIYNHYVLHSTCTYQEEPETMDDRRRWFTRHCANHPIIVAEADGQVIGWGSLSPYHARSAYRYTVENSVYVRHDMHRRGVGALLLGDLIVRARKFGHRVIIAVIDGRQTSSVVLHEKFGFEKVGHFKEVGLKFGSWLDVVYLELNLAA